MSLKLTTQAPEAPPAKPAEAKFNPMRPDMPQIPGVDKKPRKSESKSAGSFSLDEDKRRLLMAGALGGAVLGVMLLLWWAINKPKGATPAPSEPEAAEQRAPAISLPDPPAKVQVGPTVAATTQELSRPWAAKKFIFARPLTRENIEAMVIRLPGGGLWAFSLQDAFGRCQLEFVTDLATISSRYGYSASHPMVVNPCDKTVYDPLKVGSIGGDTYARGGIVQGSGLRPPIAIDVKIDGNSIIADGIE